MSNLKAFHVDDMTIWAAENAEQASASYREWTGEGCIDDYPQELTDAELDAPQQERDENEAPTGEMTSIRAWLAELSEPGFLAGEP